MSVGLLKRRPIFFVIRANRRRAFLRVASRTYGSFHQISVERREFPTDEYPNHVRIFFLSIRDFSVSICGKDEVADETTDSDRTTHYRKNPTRFIYIFFRPVACFRVNLVARISVEPLFQLQMCGHLLILIYRESAVVSLGNCWLQRAMGARLGKSAG